jgi:hypothetical protein
VSRLVGPQPVGFDHPAIVLHHVVGDDDVADVQLRIQTTGDPGERNRPAMESVGQQRCYQPGVDLAHTGCGQHHRMHVEFAGIEGDVCDLFAVVPGQDAAQIIPLLRDGTHDADRHRDSLEPTSNSHRRSRPPPAIVSARSGNQQRSAPRRMTRDSAFCSRDLLLSTACSASQARALVGPTTSWLGEFSSFKVCGVATISTPPPSA